MWTDGEMVATSFVQSYLSRENFPLDINRVVLAIEKKLDIRIFIEEHYGPEEIIAQLTCSEFNALILVNSRHSMHKKRMAIAHEFGHLLLEHEFGNPYIGLSEPDRETDEADNFAAALLVPSWNLLGLVKRYPDSFIFLVHKVSQYFGVELEAAARRLATTDFLPGLFALLDPATSRKEWEYHSPSIHLDHEAFRHFLVHHFQNPKKREEDLEIMGYPFRVETKRIWGDKVLLTCMPFTMPTLCVRETAAGYGI